MNRRLQIKLTMYLMVKSEFESIASKMLTLPEFEMKKTAFEAKLETIIQATGRMNYTSAGVKQSKEEAKSELVNDAWQVASKVLAYARVKKMDGLVSEVNYPNYAIARLSMQNMLSVCETIYARAMENLDGMEGYRLTEEMVAQLRSSIDAFREASIAPEKQRHLNRLTARDTELLFDEADALLADIDVVVELLRFDLPEVYEKYKLSRRLRVIPSPSLSVKGVVKDSTTQLPINSATLEFVELESVGGVPTGDEPVLVKSSADKGGFWVKSLPEGVYRVRVNKIGYKEQSVELIVKAREMSDLVLTLESA